MTSKELQTKQDNYWTASDKEEIIKMLAIVIANQKTFGKEYSVKDVFAFYDMKLNGRFTKDEVLAAIDAYTDSKSDIPQPADLISIMEPAPAKITYEQYKQALKQHELEGYAMFGYYGQVIKDYNKQTATENETPSYYEILERRQNYALENKSNIALPNILLKITGK